MPKIQAEASNSDPVCFWITPQKQILTLGMEVAVTEKTSFLPGVTTAWKHSHPNSGRHKYFSNFWPLCLGMYHSKEDKLISCFQHCLTRMAVVMFSSPDECSVWPCYSINRLRCVLRMTLATQYNIFVGKKQFKIIYFFSP